MKGCTHSPLAADVRGDTKHEGSLNVSALVIRFRKSNFKLPRFKMFVRVYISVFRISNVQ